MGNLGKKGIRVKLDSSELSLREVLMGPDFHGGCLEGIDMNHPPTDLWHELPARNLAF